MQTSALPLGYGAGDECEGVFVDTPSFFGADDEARTRYLNLGKVALYRMSYIRKFASLETLGVNPRRQ